MKTIGLKARREIELKPPKGFDIDMLTLFIEYDFTEEEVKKLGELTHTRRGIPHAFVGNQVFYRRSSIESIFNKKPRIIGGS